MAENETKICGQCQQRPATTIDAYRSRMPVCDECAKNLAEFDGMPYPSAEHCFPYFLEITCSRCRNDQAVTFDARGDMKPKCQKCMNELEEARYSSEHGM